MLFTAPVHRLNLLEAPVATPVVIAFGAVFLMLLTVETIADQQQWTFQSIKKGLMPQENAPSFFGAAGEEPDTALKADLERGFLTHGLFRLSRHPNYFGELGVWWTLYLFASVAGGGFLNWSGIGVVLLTALFLGSTRFTESISSARYQQYREYQERTSAVVPWIPAEPAQSLAD